MREAELVRRARDGNQAAFEQLYLLHVDRVSRLVKSICGPTADIEDLVQETFISVLKRLGSYRRECAFSTWLHRVAVNTCLSALRSRKRRRHREESAQLTPELLAPRGPEEFDPERHRRLLPFYRALNDLKPVNRVAFVLYHVEGYTLEEIGSVTESRVSTVSERIRTARKQLRRSIERANQELRYA